METKEEYYIDRVLIDRHEIEEIVEIIAKEISADYRDSKSLVMICILKGSTLFFADLVREIDINVEMDFMQLSSYGGGLASSGEVRIVKDLQSSIAGKDVIIVEDIIDSGRTAKCLLEMLWTRKPNSLKYCTLLDKPDRRVTNVVAHYVGKIIPDEFVVGYGLDYNEKWRNLKDVCVLASKKA